MTFTPTHDGNVSLVVPPERMSALKEGLAALKAEFGVEAALLVDNAGRLIAQEGAPPEVDILAVSALAAGNLATLRVLANKLKESRFSLIFQRKNQLSVYLQAVGEHALLLVLFSEAAPLGVVRLRVKATLTALERELEACALAEEKLAEQEAAPAGGFRPAPPSLLRLIWRLKQLIRDCQGAGVEAKAPLLWREAEAQVRLVVDLRAKGDFEPAERAAQRAEGVLMRALERALGLEGSEGDQRDFGRISFFMDLMAMTTLIYKEWMGDKALLALDNVDREIRQKYPLALKEWAKGRFERAAMDRYRAAQGADASLGLVKAFLAVLLNRAWTVDKVFGTDAGQQLLESWQQVLHDRWQEVLRLDLGKPMHWLMSQARKRSTTPGAAS